jgi:hypothetical protein
MEIDLISRGRRGTNGAVTALTRYWVAQVLSIPSAWRKGWCRHEQRFEHDELLELLKFAPTREAKLRRPPKALDRIITAQPLADLLGLAWASLALFVLHDGAIFTIVGAIMAQLM